MLESKKIRINQLEFDTLVSGYENDQLVILLHGFPESSYVFRRLIEDLVSHGYYCIAPNLRGYSTNARPRGKKNYEIKHLVSDVLEIAKSVNKERFHLIGHDWGSAIGWQVAHDYPELIISWTGISVPHPQSFFEAILNDPEQQKKSKYIRLFQLPILPELNIKFNDFKLLRQLWNEQSEDEIENYLSILKEPGALTAMLNYYRAGYKVIKQARKKQIMEEISVPTLFIWGNKDVAIGKKAVDESHRFMKGEYSFLELDGGHWLIQTHFIKVKEAILDHLEKFKNVHNITYKA